MLSPQTQKLKQAYGDRLVDVMLFRSWVRGEAHVESDVDLLVVLDRLDDRAAERNRVVDMLFHLEADLRRAGLSRFRPSGRLVLSLRSGSRLEDRSSSLDSWSRG